MDEDKTKTEEKGTDAKPPEGNLPEPAMRVLEEIKAKLEKTKEEPEEKRTTVPPSPTSEELQRMREDIRKQTGMTEAQLNYLEQLQQRSQAPVLQELGWMKLKDRHTDLDEFRKGVEEELSRYNPSNVTPELMDKIYYMVKGREISQGKTSPRHDPRVLSEKIAKGYTGTDEGLSAPEENRSSETPSLKEEEKIFAKGLGVEEKDFVKYRKSRNIGKGWAPVSIDPRTAGAADRELSRLRSQHGGKL